MIKRKLIFIYEGKVEIHYCSWLKCMLILNQVWGDEIECREGVRDLEVA